MFQLFSNLHYFLRLYQILYVSSETLSHPYYCHKIPELALGLNLDQD